MTLAAPSPPAGRRLAPTVALALAALLLALSLLLPYWELTLVTAERPAGVKLQSHFGRLEGDGEAVLALGGGPGALRLRQLARLERSLATCGVALACMLAFAAALVDNRWAALLALPAIAFPAIVVADTAHWLRSLTDRGGPGGEDASLPALFGRLVTSEFVLETRMGSGLLVAVAAALVVVVGLVLHRAAYRVA